jgi:hypothetical protein
MKKERQKYASVINDKMYLKKVTLIFFVLFYILDPVFGQKSKSTFFIERLEPIGTILNYSKQDTGTWSCSPIYGPDGMVHVFFTRVPQPSLGFSQQFRKKGEIWHAVAKNPEGPYELKGTVLQPRGEEGYWDSFGHVNPRVYQVGDRYALFYTTYEVPWPREKMFEHIGLLISNDLINWTQANNGKPILSPDPTSPFDSMIVNNASLVQFSGKFYLYYRGISELSRSSICLAIADSLEGPYKRVNSNPIIDVNEILSAHGGRYRGFEDPVVWIEDGIFKMLVKSMGWNCFSGGGVYFESEDGLNWSLPQVGYYNCEHYWNEEGTLDSPLILLDENNQPEYFFFNIWTPDNFGGAVFKIH